MKKLHTNPMNEGSEPLLIKEMGEDKYRIADGLNKSLLVPFMQSPFHYKHELENKKQPTENMKLGTALHAELLLPRPSDVYAVCKKVDKRKTEGKEYFAQFTAENVGKTVIDEDQYESLKGMKEGLYRNAFSRRILEQATDREVAMFGTRNCEHGKVRLKGMADIYDSNNGILADIKTVDSATKDSFKWAMKDFSYDIQQVHYTWLAINAGLPFSKFMFIVCERKKPWATAVYQLSTDSYMRAFDRWSKALDYFSHCQERNDFESSYPEEAVEISI
jgi:hypothetical protein